ncbi:MAG: NAD-binding protein [Anaerolineaceae bacterium]
MKIIIIGCGRVGAGLAKNLSIQGIDVVVIDKDPQAFEALKPAYKGKTVVGIGFDQKVLSDAGINRADALVAVTASDEANLVAARMAKMVYHVPRVAARVFEPQKAKIYRRMGIQTVSPVTLGINRLTSTLVYSHLNIERVIGAGQVNLVDADVKPQLVNHLVKETDVPGEIQVVAITRNGKTFIPNPATVFQADDLVHIFVQIESKDKVSRIFGV